MLNELLVVMRGAEHAEIEIPPSHPDVKFVGQMPTLKVQLNEVGNVNAVSPIPSNVKLWTLRNGQQNSFPFVQPKFGPLLEIRTDYENKEINQENLLELLNTLHFNFDSYKDWPSDSFLKCLVQRRRNLGKIGNTGTMVTATIDRFLIACERNMSPSSHLLAIVVKLLKENLEKTIQDDWIKLSSSLLVGKKDEKKGRWMCKGALLFEAAGFPISISDKRIIAPLCSALDEDTSNKQKEMVWDCLTNKYCTRHAGNFNQLNLPVIGQTYIFAKNKDIPAASRYNRNAGDGIPVGKEIINSLAGVLEALTIDERKNKTWRSIPGEAPKKKNKQQKDDLLLAFVEKWDASLTEVLAEEDFSEEDMDPVTAAANSVAIFEQRTERLIRTIRGETDSNLLNTPVQMIIIRSVDRGNAKVIYRDVFSAASLNNAATTWASGERNAPPWLKLTIYVKTTGRSCLLPPPHIAPLGLIVFSKKSFIRGATTSQEVTGIYTSETMRFFLDSTDDHTSKRRAKHILWTVLARRMSLIINVAGILHTPYSWNRKNKYSKKLNNREALRTVTVLGILLYKLGRYKEVYMNEAAFKLGQLLAAADIVHAGYCADVRGGDVPPSLLGNQVFSIAQNNPTRALAILCQRWKPYDGWSKKISHEVKKQAEIERLIKNKNQKGWDIKKALRHAREMGPLAAEIAPTLVNCQVDDTFRAELLLGYIAGLPRMSYEDTDSENQNHISNGGKS